MGVLDDIMASKSGSQGPAAGGGPLAAIMGGKAAGVPTGEVQSVQNSNNSLLADIMKSNNPGAEQAAGAAANNNAGGGWFHSVLGALDMPRAAVVSGLHGVLSGDLSPSDWLHNTEGHMTFGHVLNNDLGIHNHLVDSIGGMVGDVGLDPLTYLGGLGEVAKAAGLAGHVVEGAQAAADAARMADKAAQTAQGVRDAQLAGSGLAEALTAHKAAQGAADAAAQAAKEKTLGVITPDTLARFQTKGIAGLNSDERAALSTLSGTNVTSGLGLRVPGSKLAGNPQMIPLVPGSMTDPLASALKGLTSRVADTKVVSGLEKALIPHAAIKAGIRAAAQEGDGEKVAGLQNILRLANVAGGKARDVLNTHGPAFQGALTDLEAKGVLQHAPAALEGSPEALSAIQAAGGDIGPLQDAYGAIRQEAANHGLQMGNIENYFPHTLTDQAREIFATAPNKGKASGAFANAAQRVFTPGTSFLGHEITDPRVSGESIIEQMNRHANDVYGDGKTAFDLFKTDPREVTTNYLRGISRSIGQHHFLNELDKAGVTASGDMALTPEEWTSLSRALTSASKREASHGAQASDLGNRLGVASGMAASTASPKAPLSTWLQGSEGDFVKNLLGQMGAAKGSGNRFNLADLVTHSDTMRQLLEEEAHAAGVSSGDLAARARTAEGSADEAAKQGLVRLGPNRVAPTYVKDALQKLADESSGGVAGGKFLQTYDRWLNIWKQYSLAMPGKAMRHTLAGPAWGSYLGNVGTKSLRQGFSEWRAFQHAMAANGGDVEAAMKGLSPEAQDALRAGIEHGSFHGHEFNLNSMSGQEKVLGSTKLGQYNKYNPMSTKHGYFKANAEAQKRGQDYWRYAMIRDAMKKGALAPEAAQKTRMFLGDPHNITNAERGTLRRVVPFYTFLRQNIPVELKNLATQPGKFVNAVQAPSQEISQWSPQQGIVPEMFKQTGAIPLPWKIGGNEVYVSPDLPFSRFSEMTGGLNQIESQTSPLVQAAIERINNVNTFTNTPFSPYGKPMAGADLPAVLGPILHAIDPQAVYQTQKASSDYGQTTPAGQWQMTPRAHTILGNILPLLVQAEGLYTAGAPNKATRGDTSVLDALTGGAVFRTNDPSQQAGELLRRQAVLKQMVEQLQNKGELPKYLYGFHA